MGLPDPSLFQIDGMVGRIKCLRKSDLIFKKIIENQLFLNYTFG